MVVDEQIYVSPHGTVFACVSKAECQFMWKKIHVEGEYGTTWTSARSGVVVDVGTNIGMFCSFAAQKGLTVYGFEPIPALAACARKNAPSSIISEVAISDVDSKVLELDYLPNYTMLSGAGAAENAKMYNAAAKGTLKEDAVTNGFEGAKKVSVQTKTLSTALCEAGQSGKIDFLKIDCEMMEDRVLSGMGDELWARVAEIAIEVHDVNGRIEHCVELLKARGFEVSKSDKAPPSFILGEYAKANMVKGLDACLVMGTKIVD